MKIEPGHGVVFLLRSTKGIASYGSAEVRKANDHSVTIEHASHAPHVIAATPKWIYGPNILTFTEGRGSALALASELNRLDREERMKLDAIRVEYELLRQRAVDQFQLSEKENEQ